MERDWDWDRPFDEDFVRGAAAREDSGEVRADRAARIASQHAASGTWRSDRPHLDTRHRPARQRGARRPTTERRRSAIVLTAVVGVLAAVAFLGLRDDGSGAAAPFAQPSPDVSVDVRLATQPARVLPLPAAVPGTGGYRFSGAVADEPTPRFDPCLPVRWVTRAGDAPRGGSALLQTAFDRLSQATGLAFVSGGTTDEAPSDDRPDVQPGRYGPGYAPVLVAWSDDAESPMLAGDTAGYAGPTVGDDGSGPRLVSGEVVLDSAVVAELLATPAGAKEALGLVLHELAHLVGLDHVTDPADTMYAESGPGTQGGAFTQGALRGLRVAGDGPCAA